MMCEPARRAEHCYLFAMPRGPQAALIRPQPAFHSGLNLSMQRRRLPSCPPAQAEGAPEPGVRPLRRADELAARAGRLLPRRQAQGDG